MAGDLFSTTFDDTNFPDRDHSPRTGIHWETSDYFDDSQDPGQPPVGISIGANLNLYPSGGGANGDGDDGIITAANNPLGSGKGFRHWIGDGLNNNGGGINIQWTSSPEIYIRYYARFPLGFHWVNGVDNPIDMKMFYVEQGQDNGFYFGLHNGFVGLVINGTNIIHSSAHWSDVQGGTDGDGQFHCYEVRMKMNNPAASANGIVQIKVDDVLVYSDTAVQISPTAGVQYGESQVGSNQNQPDNGGLVYVDYDDIAISALDWNGPLGGGGGEETPVVRPRGSWSMR